MGFSAAEDSELLQSKILYQIIGVRRHWGHTRINNEVVKCWAVVKNSVTFCLFTGVIGDFYLWLFFILIFVQHCFCTESHQSIQRSALNGLFFPLTSHLIAPWRCFFGGVYHLLLTMFWNTSALMQFSRATPKAEILICKTGGFSRLNLDLYFF